jgi:hypothetical protein
MIELNNSVVQNRLSIEINKQSDSTILDSLLSLNLKTIYNFTSFSIKTITESTIQLKVNNITEEIKKQNHFDKDVIREFIVHLTLNTSNIQFIIIRDKEKLSDKIIFTGNVNDVDFTAFESFYVELSSRFKAKNKEILLNEQLSDSLEDDRKEAIKVLLKAGLIAETKKLINKSYPKRFWLFIKDIIGKLSEKDKEFLLPLNLGDHENVARRVFRRLLLRNAQLTLLTDLTQKYFPKNQIKNEELDTIQKVETTANLEISKPDVVGKSVKEFKTSETLKTYQSDKTNQNDNTAKKTNQVDSSLRAYRHAITDLFVEKAITYLEMQAGGYRKNGNRAYFFGFMAIIISVVVACLQYLEHTTKLLTYFFIKENWIKDSILEASNKTKDSLPDIISTFIVSFTIYGFLVLLAVGCWRYGRAMLDQAERLLEKRHALRQGRLFVHLQDGNMTIEDMEKAFNWNLSNINAFTHMSTDAKAPWGVVVSEAIKAGADIVKNSKDVKDTASKASK